MPWSSQPGNNPCCAAQISGPRPPGPPPTMTEDSMFSPPPPGSAEYFAKYSCDPLDDLFVDGARGRQADAGGGQIGAVRAVAGVLLVRRQGRQGMEEGPHLDLGVVRRCHD